MFEEHYTAKGICSHSPSNRTEDSNSRWDWQNLFFESLKSKITSWRCFDQFGDFVNNVKCIIHLTACEVGVFLRQISQISKIRPHPTLCIVLVDLVLVHCICAFEECERGMTTKIFHIHSTQLLYAIALSLLPMHMHNEHQIVWTLEIKQCE